MTTGRPRWRQRVAGGGVAQLGDGPEVARHQLVDGLGVLAPHGEQPVQSLVGARPRVHEVVAVADGAREHLQDRDLPDVGIGERLDDHGQRVAVGIGRHLDGGVPGPHGAWPVGGRRADLDDQVGEPVDADLRGGGAAEHGYDGAGLEPQGEGVLQLLDGGLLALEVPLEEGIVGHHDALDHLVVDLVLEVLELGGDLLGVGGAVLVDLGGVGEDVGHAPERGLRPDGQLQRRDVGAEALADLLEGALEAGPLPVELVHEDQVGHAELLGQAPDGLGLDLDAVDRAHHEQRQVGGLQRGEDLRGEVGVARGVDEVHLVAVPLEGRQRQRQRHGAPLLLRFVVADRRAVLDAASAGDDPGPVEQAPRPGWSCLSRCAPRGRRCGSSPTRPSARSLLPPGGRPRPGRPRYATC
jgi:hypothetical protein